MTGIVHLKQVNFIYESKQSAPYQALFDVNFDIQPGEFVAVTGQSGSGKSTLMNLIGTLSLPTSGDLVLNGQNVRELPNESLAYFRNKTIGFVFQQFHLLPRLTVLENILLPCGYLIPKPNASEFAEIEARAFEIMDMLGIRSQASKKPETLSGGQKQRVAISRALLLNPQIILADEPTGALDSQTSKDVMNILTSLNAMGKTIIVITHDPEVTRYAKRNLVFKDGHLVEDKLLPMTAETSGGTKSAMVEPQFVIKKESVFRSFLLRYFSSVIQAWQALTAAKLRTVLTALGLMIGVASICIMLTLGWGAQKVILDIFAQEGADRVWVGPEWRRAQRFYWRGLSIDYELPKLQQVFQKYAAIQPSVGAWQEKVALGGVAFDTNVRPIFDVVDFLQNNKSVARGRMLAPHEFERGMRVAVVGSEFEQSFAKNFPKRLLNPNFPIGEWLNLRGQLNTAVLIVGVLPRKDSMFGDSNANQVIYMPYQTYSRYSNAKYTSWISLVPEKGVNQRWLGDSVKNFLNVKLQGRTSFRAEVPEETISKIMNFIYVFQGLTALIGFLCIVVSGIGIMNIMLVTIIERIREIGLRYALGATPQDIKKLFLTESSLLCVVSGLSGSLVGIGFCNVVGVVGHLIKPDVIPLQFLFYPSALLIAVLTSLGCGIVFGMAPALRASRLLPAEALRAD